MNFVQYAEDKLGVHAPWDDAQRFITQHEEATTKLKELRPQIRSLKIQIDDRKLEIVTGAAGSWNDVAATVRKERIKGLVDNDPDLRELEGELFDAQQALDHAEADIKHAEVVLHAVTARMIELGGLLTFYAINKSREPLAMNVTLKPLFDFTELLAQAERYANPLKQVDTSTSEQRSTSTSD